MHDMTYRVADILPVISGELVAGSPDATFSTAVIDSRAVSRETAFFALPGVSAHGNTFLGDAARAGAPVVFSEGEKGGPHVQAAVDAGSVVICVDDALQALQALGVYQRDRLENVVVIGITGSSGKTTTKEFVKAIAASKYRTHATTGNLNNHIGVPLTLVSAPLDTEVLIVEMGMNAAGEIAAVAEMARPHVGVITNVGTSHIGMLGSREAIADAKSELIDVLAPTKRADAHPSRAILPYEDAYLSRMVSEHAIPGGVFVATFGLHDSADFSASDIHGTEEGTTFSLKPIVGPKVDVTIGFLGEHMVRNALAALTVADYLDIPLTDAVEALATVQPAAHRQRLITSSAGFHVLDDTYNANPDSMRAAVRVLASRAGVGSTYAVLGTMAELGDEASERHMELGRDVAMARIDGLCFVGRFGEDVVRGAVEAGMDEKDVAAVETVDEAVAWVREHAEAGATVLVKASRSAALERVVEGIL